LKQKPRFKQPLLPKQTKKKLNVYRKLLLKKDVKQKRHKNKPKKKKLKLKKLKEKGKGYKKKPNKKLNKRRLD